MTVSLFQPTVLTIYLHTYMSVQIAKLISHEMQPALTITDQLLLTICLLSDVNQSTNQSTSRERENRVAIDFPKGTVVR